MGLKPTYCCHQEIGICGCSCEFSEVVGLCQVTSLFTSLSPGQPAQLILEGFPCFCKKKHVTPKWTDQQLLLMMDATRKTAELTDEPALGTESDWKISRDEILYYGLNGLSHWCLVLSQSTEITAELQSTLCRVLQTRLDLSLPVESLAGINHEGASVEL